MIQISSFFTWTSTDAQVIRLKDLLHFLHPKNAIILLASTLFLSNHGKQFLEFLFQQNLCKIIQRQFCPIEKYYFQLSLPLKTLHIHASNMLK